MKKLLIILFFSRLLFGEFNPNICATYMGDSAFSAKAKNSCVIDSNLDNWIKCREYFKQNMLNGRGYHGENHVEKSPTFMYNYFNKEIKKVLLKEVKNVINKNQSIMCIENSEDSLFKYEESIAEHEWCYAPKFLSAFDDELMSEHEMKYAHFINLYKIRSDMLESKEKPKDKTKLCGVYLECMSAFVNANHTQVSSGLRALYEKTKKECISSYFTIKTDTEYRSNSSETFADKGSLHSSWHSSKSSKQIMHIDPKRGIIEVVGIKSDAKGRYESEGDKFDLKSCSIVHKRGKTRVDDNPDDSLAHIGKHNIFNANSSNAFIELSVTNNNFTKRFRVPWSSLKSNGSWSGSGSKSKFDEPSAKEKEMENNIKNTEVYGKLMSGLNAAKAIAPGNRAKMREAVDTLGLQGEGRCKTIYGFDLMLGGKVNLTFNANIKVNITPASKSDISDFKMQKDIGHSNTIRARKIELTKYEKESNGLFGNLENSMYDSLSQKEQRSWNKAEKDAKKRAKAKKQEEQDKKDAAEFDNISIDDLEMFTE